MTTSTFSAEIIASITNAITSLTGVIVAGLGVVLPVVAVLIGLGFSLRYVKKFIGRSK